MSVMHFTEELKEFWAYPLLFKDFIPRLTQCSNPVLNQLMEIPGKSTTDNDNNNY